MKKLIRNGMIAVLVSHGYGAGWSTWHSDEQLLFDPEIVLLVEKFRNESMSWDDFNEAVEKHCLTEYPEGVYLGGVDGLRVHWLTPGTRFSVREYDGAEFIELEKDMEWSVA